MARYNYRYVITQAFRDILLREPDAAGLEAWNDGLNAGATEASLRIALITSPEFLVRFKEGDPEPPGPGVKPLRVEGGQFVTADGPMKLLGMIVAGDDPESPVDEGKVLGWPLMTDAALELLAANKCNYTHVRTGPFTGEGEESQFAGYLKVPDGRYDLNTRNLDFFLRLRQCVAKANSLGIYVEVDVIDFWVLDHSELSPWSIANNVNGFDGGGLAMGGTAPHQHAQIWARTLVDYVGDSPNVLWSLGNEDFKGAGPQWVQGSAAVIRDQESFRGQIHKPIGTSSGHTEFVDYVINHERDVPEPGPMPTIVNEYQDMDPTNILVKAKLAHAQVGTHFMYWRGDRPTSEMDTILAGLKLIMEGGDPVPFPDSCPRLVRWQARVYTVLDPHFQPRNPPIPQIGDRVRIDTTPRFGSGRGQPCNDEHNEACGGRPCEDPRGGIFTLLQGSASVKVEQPGPNSGYQCMIGPLTQGGTYEIQIKALPDAHDALGKPLDVAADHARSVSFTVGESVEKASAEFKEMEE